MPVDNFTVNQNYPLIDPANDLDDDAPRLVNSIVAIDSDMGTLFASLAGKAEVGHTHSIADVAGLAAALDGKAAAAHQHNLDDLGNVDVGTAVNLQYFMYNGIEWIPTKIDGGHIQTGTIASGRLPASITYTNIDATISGDREFTGEVAVRASNPAIALKDRGGGTQLTSTMQINPNFGSGVLYGHVGILVQEWDEAANPTAATGPVTGLGWSYFGADADAPYFFDRNGTKNTLYHDGNLSGVSKAEAEAGIATTARSWSAERVAQAIAAQSDNLSVSADLSITIGAPVNKVAHGLAAAPTLFGAVLVCQIAEAGYAVGDLLMVGQDGSYQHTPYADGSDVGIAFYSTSNFIRPTFKDGSNTVTLDPTKWKIRFWWRA